MNNKPPCIFLISCARSGSSILAETLGSHPDIEYLGEEPQAFWHNFSQTPDHHEIGAEIATDEIANRFYDEWLAPYRPKIALDKCPPNSLRIPFLRALTKDTARFIHLIRDGRDVALSLIPGLCGNSWSHLKPSHWQKIEEMYQGVMRGAMLWEYVVNKASHDLEGAQVITVKYEDLIYSPVSTTMKVLRFLGIAANGETGSRLVGLQLLTYQTIRLILTMPRGK